MKEFMGTAVNITLAETDDGKTKGLTAVAELIVLVSEPVYEADAAGQMQRRRRMDQFRMGISLGGIRKLIGHLEEYAEEMESMEARYVLASSELETTDD